MRGVLLKKRLLACWVRGSARKSVRWASIVGGVELRSGLGREEWLEWRFVFNIVQWRGDEEWRVGSRGQRFQRGGDKR